MKLEIILMKVLHYLWPIKPLRNCQSKKRKSENSFLLNVKYFESHILRHFIVFDTSVFP